MKKKQKRVAIAVDIGATNLRVALVRDDGKIIKKLMTKTPQKGRSGKVVTDKVIAQIKKLLRDKNTDIVGIGVSSAGPLDTKKGILVSPTNIVFSNVAIAKPLEKAFRCTTFLLNDANAATLGEKVFGSGKNVQNLVYITVSTGIGAGAVVDGRLLYGARGNVGEVGNFFVDNAIALSKDSSGRSTEWGCVASGSKIVEFFSVWKDIHNVVTKNFHPRSAGDLYTAAQRGNSSAKKFIDDVAKIHARGLINIMAAYDPEIIVLGGPVVHNNTEIFMRLLKKHLRKNTLVARPRIIVTKLGDSISLLGAAAFVFEKIKE